jgi:hypothetical protein
MAWTPRRTYLGGRRGGLADIRVYRVADALEIDEGEGLRIRRRRVLFDEILLVTYHRQFGWPFVVIWSVLLALGSTAAVIVGATEGRLAGAIVCSVLALPFLVLLSLWLTLRLDVVTVYGKRGRAQMRFWWRKRRAREVYETIGRLAREHQQRAGPTTTHEGDRAATAQAVPVGPDSDG